MKTIQSQLLARIPGIVHGFGTTEEPIPAPLAGVWSAKAELKQVHGANLIELTEPAQNAENADGTFTCAAGIPTVVITADCVPILLARKDGGMVAAVHAGWRGTKARILRELWDRLRVRGERPQHWVAAIGPSIGACCYEVSEELAEDFCRDFKSRPRELILPNPRHLDLTAINHSELVQLGVSEIEAVPMCTRCARDQNGAPRFHSYRRERSGGRQYSGLAIKN